MTLKEGQKVGDSRKKKVRVESMGQSGAGGRTERRIEWYRCAGGQTKRIGFRTGQNGSKLGIPLVCPGQPALGGQNKRSFGK
jgi:hypothetical protein